jgi:hypothetical protein
MSTTDEKRRKREREARLGDSMAAAMAGNDDQRRGLGLATVIDALVGKVILIEGVRINLHGKLSRVYYYPDGMPAIFVLAPGSQRVSYFERGGPTNSSTYTYKGERYIDYAMIHDFGESGFREGQWKAPE